MEKEYEVCKHFHIFTPILFNLDNFLDGDEIWCSKRATNRDAPSMLRCHALTEQKYDQVYKALLTFRYRLIQSVQYSREFKFNNVLNNNFTNFAVPTKDIGETFGSYGYLYAKPSLYIIRDDDGYLEDDVRSSVVIGGEVNKDLMEKI